MTAQSKIRSLLYDQSKGKSASEQEELLQKIRYIVLTEGLPFNWNDEGRDFSLRGDMWKVFLGLTASHHMSAQAYMKVVQEGPSTYDEKIRADTYRTFATDANFKAFVPEAKLIRLLNGYCNVSGQPYVQGMNILVAPFLVVLTEAEAFFCIQRLFSSWIPQYVYFSSSGNQQSLPGVHAGLAILEDCLQAMDPELSAHLTQQHLSAAIYGFEALMSLCASWSPLSEVIPLWDYLLTFGPHHVVFLFLAHMQLRREELLGCHSAGGLQKLLKTSPAEGWQAGRICRQAAHLAKSCDPKLYERVRRHTINPTVG